MFDISLRDELVTQPVSKGVPGSDAVYGRIHIEEYQETFIASLSFWNRPQYERHWAHRIAENSRGQGSVSADYIVRRASIEHNL